MSRTDSRIRLFPYPFVIVSRVAILDPNLGFYIPMHTENKIDGESFLELCEADVKEMVKPIGIIKKIMKLLNKCKIAMVSLYYYVQNCIGMPTVWVVTISYLTHCCSL